VKALYLLRHAKSSWNESGLADHDRPLAPRGTKATHALAHYIAASHVEPALVLCSTATRARQTLDGVRQSFGADVDVWHEDALYGADASELLDRLRRLPPAVPSVMVVGHNPGLEDLALALAGGGRDGLDNGDAALAGLHRKFPTGALATFVIDGDWASLGPRETTLTAFVVPRDLE